MKSSNGFEKLGKRVLVALLTRQVFTPETLGAFLNEEPRRVGSELSHLYCNSFLSRLLERKQVSSNRFSYQLTKGIDLTKEDLQEVINATYGQYRSGKYVGWSAASRHGDGTSRRKEIGIQNF